MLITWYWILLFLSIFYLLGCNAANILALFPHSSESHFALMRTFLKELIRQGHNITLYTGHGLDERMDNLVEYKIEPEFDFWQNVRNNAVKADLFKNLTDLSEKELEVVLSETGYNLVDNFLSNDHIEKLHLLPMGTFTFDIIIIDLFYTEALLAMCQYFDRPCIGVVSSDFANYLELMVDIMVPSACLPYDLHQTDYLDFWQRLHYTQSCLERRQRTIDGHYMLQLKLVHKFFSGRIKDLEILSIPSLQSRLTLLLLNNYPPLQLPRPLSINMISVGGMQIGRPQDLPWHIKRFLDEAPKGVVYINLGDHHQCSTINQNIVQILLQVLKELELRVIWTCHQKENEKPFENLPGDFMIQHLIPQTDILAHPHIKLFITNGDLVNLQDGIVRQVPILGLPLFNNEIKNVKLVEYYQIGVRLNYENVTDKSLRWALDEIWNNQYYVLNIRSLAKVFRDRPLGGLAQAIFWLEYVVNYGGTHLTMPPSPVTLQQIHLQDLYIYKVCCVIVVAAFVAIFGYVSWIYFKNQQTKKITSKLN